MIIDIICKKCKKSFQKYGSDNPQMFCDDCLINQKIIYIRTDLVKLLEERKSEMSINVYEYINQIIQTIDGV